MQRSPFRPPTLRHLVGGVVVGHQPGDFAGHKSEIVFWHMNMLCIKRRRKTRPQSEPEIRITESDSHFGRQTTDDRHFYYYQCMYEFLSGASLCLCLCLRLALPAADDDIGGHRTEADADLGPFWGCVYVSKGCDYDSSLHPVPSISLSAQKDKLFMCCKFESGEQGKAHVNVFSKGQS